MSDYNPHMRRDHPFLNVDPYQDLLEEIAPLRGKTANETAWMVSAVCASAMSIANSRPDRERVLEWEDPPSAEARDLWHRLRRDLPSLRWRQ